jgi:tetratricopeptide (TPR) repeat protein
MRQILAALMLFTLACGGGGDWPRQERAPGAQGIAFVDNSECAECHEKEYELWQGSHHQLAMQVANDVSVRGDFNDSTFTHFGVETRFFRRDGRFMVNTEGPDGANADFEVRYTFGYEPLQQYLIEFPGGKLQCLTIAWDTEQQRWYHLYQDEKIEADDPLHWTAWSQRWNLMCAECHSTNLRKNYDRETQTYKTAWDDINVGCQACHGPAAEHVRWARILPDDYTPRPGENKLAVDFKAGDSRYQVDQCARCHSRRHQTSANDLHGRAFMDNFQASTLRENLYQADGQILDEVYVYGSFLQSAMYRRGVRCSDCHDPHSLNRIGEGNALCGECHSISPPERFPTMKKKQYDTVEHHHHEPGTEGASCANCHMPERVYMGVDPRSDHSFRVPRPDLSVKLGIPNTCNDCHQDKSPMWAADAVAKWYGNEPKTTHYAEVIAAGRTGRPEAAPALMRLAQDLDQPAIVRATAAELMRVFGPDVTETLRKLAKDEDPLVRTIAVGSLDRLPPEQRVPEVAPMLEDPIRAVRMEAARVLASVPLQYLVPEQRVAYDKALAEYRETQIANTDTPSGNMNLGIVAASSSDTEAAIRDYREAINLDRAFLPAQLNLATLYNQLGQNPEAEDVLRAAIKQAPENGELRYSLGLLLAEQNRLEEATRSLKQAAQLMPSRARVRYNYALALQHLGRRNDAENELLQAYRADPADAAILNAVVIFYVQQKRLEQALLYANKLVSLAPNQTGPREMVNRIQREMRGGR